jgi:DNA-binding NarL/FixJ family response regulator
MHRVLIVDDHELFRRELRATIEASGVWIVAEAADGPSAVEKARVLRPDLTVMDVMLPSMNGIEAAKRIRAENPDARILFLSTHREWDIVDAAMATGALGYVVKADAATELLTAMEAVVRGGSFTSQRLRRLET